MTVPLDAMRNSAPPPGEPVHLILMRKVILLGLLMIVAALGLLLILRRIQLSSLILPHILSDALMGLIAGVSSRWVLRSQTAFLRIISTLAFLIGGLELLGWFTGWQIGFNPLKAGLSRVDWSSLGQLLLAAGVSLLALYAWTKPALQDIQPAALPNPPRQPPRPRRQFHKPRRTQAQTETRTLPVVEPVNEGVVDDQSAVRHKPQLQLSSEEEHRCPYCLELIEPDDPRGTVECSVCHSLHHADCWAITGTCQVPHFTA